MFPKSTANPISTNFPLDLFAKQLQIYSNISRQEKLSKAKARTISAAKLAIRHLRQSIAYRSNSCIWCFLKAAWLQLALNEQAECIKEFNCCLLTPSVGAICSWIENVIAFFIANTTLRECETDANADRWHSIIFLSTFRLIATEESLTKSTSLNSWMNYWAMGARGF